MLYAPARRMQVYKKEVEAPADLAVGEIVQLVRADGPGEGDRMGYATITASDAQGGLEFAVAEKVVEALIDERVAD